MIKAPLTIRIKNSFKGIWLVFKNPLYIVFAIFIAFFMSGFIIWALNFDLVQYIVFEAPISLVEKARFFWDVQTGIYTAYAATQATGIIVFSILFGINSSLILYVFKNLSLKNIPKKSGGTGLVLALLSGGCIACGTSILAPLFASVGATSTAVFSDISNILNWLGSILIIYSIYKLGYVVNNTKLNNA